MSSNQSDPFNFLLFVYHHVNPIVVFFSLLSSGTTLLLIIWKVFPNKATCKAHHRLLFLQCCLNFLSSSLIFYNFSELFTFPNEIFQQNLMVAFNVLNITSLGISTLAAWQWLVLLEHENWPKHICLLSIIIFSNITAAGVYLSSIFIIIHELLLPAAWALNLFVQIGCIAVIRVKCERLMIANQRGKDAVLKGILLKIFSFSILLAWALSDQFLYFGLSAKRRSFLLYFSAILTPVGCLYFVADAIFTLWIFKRYFFSEKLTSDSLGANESSLFETTDVENFKSASYLLIQLAQVGMNGFSIVSFLALFCLFGFYPKHLNINAKILLAFFLIASFAHSAVVFVCKLHYVLMSQLAVCIRPWILPFYMNVHLLYIVVSNAPFWFLLALILERLAAVMAWRNYESAGPVLSIFLIIFAMSGTAVHTVFPYFGNGIMGMSIDLTNAFGVQDANMITNFFISTILFHGTIAISILYCISRKKLVHCKSKLMSPYQLVENVRVSCLLLKIFILYLLVNLATDFYLDYVDLPVFGRFLRKNNFDAMVIHRCLLPIQMGILYWTMKHQSDRNNFA